MVGREVLDIEDVAHIVLVAWEVDLVSVVVVALGETMVGPWG